MTSESGVENVDEEEDDQEMNFQLDDNDSPRLLTNLVAEEQRHTAKTSRSTSTRQTINFHENYLKLGLWPELSYQQQAYLKNTYMS